MEPTALSGITVLELTTGVAGAACGQLLALLGADVIKLETPARPDVTRTAGPFPDDVADPERSGWHRHLHARKRSVALDVATPDGLALFRRLAERADVVLDDGALGRPPEVATVYEDLVATHPRLVVNAFSAYGLTGPKAGWVSAPLTELAAAGWLQAAAPGRPPLAPGTTAPHQAVGTFGAMAVLLALQARRRTGRGQLVETRADEALLSMLTCPTTLYATSGIDGLRMGDRYPYGIYRCADGWLGISVLTQSHWTGLCELMGRDDLRDDPRFRTGVERAQPEAIAELDAVVAAWAVGQPATAAFDRGQALRVPVAIVPPPAEVLASPQYAARGYWLDVVDDALGPLRLPGAPWRTASGDAFAPYAPAPAVGAVDDVLEMADRP